MHITVGRLITKHASLNYNDFRSLIHLIQAYIRIQQTWIIDMHYTQKLSEQQLCECYNIIMQQVQPWRRVLGRCRATLAEGPGTLSCNPALGPHKGDDDDDDDDEVLYSAYIYIIETCSVRSQKLRDSHQEKQIPRGD